MSRNATHSKNTKRLGFYKLKKKKVYFAKLKYNNNYEHRKDRNFNRLGRLQDSHY